MTLAASPAPVSSKQRIGQLDTLRGVALFGVLIVNMLQAYSFIKTDADQTVATLIRVFGEGSFYPMFALLFGVGFALQLGRGDAAVPLFRKRLGSMLGIGLVHALLLWAGDILVSYALIGLALPLFRTTSARHLIQTSLSLWAVTLVFFLLGSGAFIPTDAPPSYLLPTGESYLAVVRERIPHVLASLVPELIAFGPQELALFLLGFLLGRRDLRNVLADTPFLKRVFWSSLFSALPFILWFSDTSAMFHTAGWGFVLEYVIASPLLGFVYLSGLALLLQRAAWHRTLRPFGAVGQMALSNYLGQSLLCTSLFYPYGLDLLGKLGAAQTLPLSLLIFSLQALLSTVWLRFFRFGPAEWLWRSLTYGSWQALR